MMFYKLGLLFDRHYFGRSKLGSFRPSKQMLSAVASASLGGSRPGNGRKTSAYLQAKGHKEPLENTKVGEKQAS